MKMKLILDSIPLPLALCFGLGGAAFSLHAQYSLGWQKISAGAGVHAGGAYSANGTVGEPEAGMLRGGEYAVGGGFWSLPAVVPTADAPPLAIALTRTNTAVISWPASATGWRLQRRGNLAGGAWLMSPEPVTDDGTNRFVIVHPAATQVYYRLLKP
jgi:hypothetical protein